MKYDKIEHELGYTTRQVITGAVNVATEQHRRKLDLQELELAIADRNGQGRSTTAWNNADDRIRDIWRRLDGRR